MVIFCKTRTKHDALKKEKRRSTPELGIRLLQAEGSFNFKPGAYGRIGTKLIMSPGREL